MPQGWPASAPSDVPPFPGTLANIMPQRRQAGDSYGLRMYFKGVSRDQFNAYLADLRQAGYSMEGLVYARESETEEHANERANRGEYDSVIAHKAPRVVQVTVPDSTGDEVTFNIDGLTKAESDAMPGMDDFMRSLGTPQVIGTEGKPIVATPVVWPAEWGMVPAPQGCTLGANGIMTILPGWLYVACGYPDADPAHHQAVVDAYKAQLLAAGFTMSSEQPGQGAAGMLVLEKGWIRVLIVSGAPEWLTISITQQG